MITLSTANSTATPIPGEGMMSGEKPSGKYSPLAMRCVTVVEAQKAAVCPLAFEQVNFLVIKIISIN
jgi:hypothetical protein